MPILNYTTTVPADRTFAAVQKLLVGAGARQIMSEYAADGQLIGVTFALVTASGLRAFTRVWLSWSDRDQAAAGMTPPA